ncbi:MAG: dienelactone hydrolase family protein [Rhodospirillaceae bacterium]|nr:dienelactone hydrolase family protein [Rhodospirillaceae bacterium]
MSSIQTLLVTAMLLGAGTALAAERAVEISPTGASDRFPAILLTPEGAGPFPAVVIMHDCSGLGPRSSGAPRRWGEDLVAQGYVVIIADSFSPRDLPNGVCNEAPERLRTASHYVRVADAYGALDFLRTLPIVDGKRVGIMGGSHGGSSTLASMVDPGDARTAQALAKRDGFAAGIALYPSCGQRFGTWSVTRAKGNRGPVTGYAGVYRPIAPLLILAGEADDWAPAEPCVRMAEAARALGLPLEIKVYPGAHHAFDSASRVVFNPNRNNGYSETGKGATTGGQAEAWADAKLQVQAFFARHLKERR